MAVFCCCGRRQLNKDKKSASAPDGPVMPLPPPPAVLSTASLQSQPQAAEPQPSAQMNKSKSSLPLAMPVSGAPLEPVEISELVIDDSDSGPDSPEPRRSRASSTLHFVKSHLRKHMSEDSLSRQSRAAVGSSTEELARRAELRRLMRKRIQEELQTDDSRDMDSDAPSTVLRLSGPTSHFDQLPGGGPRDNLEFSVVEAVEDVEPAKSRSDTEDLMSSSTGAATNSEAATAQEPSVSQRRVSCPDHMMRRDQKPSLRPASRAALRDRRNSLPHQSSSSHSIHVLGSSATGSSLGSLLPSENAHGVSRQAVTAVVVNGGISPKEIKRQTTIEFKETTIRHAPRRASRSPKRARAHFKSRSKSPSVSDAPDLDHSPMKTWLRCQELCASSGAGPDHDELFVVGYDGPSDDRVAVQAKTLCATDSPSLQRGDDYVSVARGSSELQGAAVLRGGALGDGDCSHVASFDYSTSPPSPVGKIDESDGGAITSRGNLSDIDADRGYQTSRTCQNSVSMSDFDSATNGFGLAVRWLHPFSSRESCRFLGSKATMAHDNASTVSLPVPGSGRIIASDPSGAVSEASSYHRRETELLSIPKRFTPGRKVDFHCSSRFREEFEESDDNLATERPSLLTRLQLLTIPKRAKLAASAATSANGSGGIAREQVGASSGELLVNKYESSSVGTIDLSSLRIKTPYHFSERSESTEDAWRRAIRAEADERRSLACGSSRRSSRRSSPRSSPITPSPCALRSMVEESRLSTLSVTESRIHKKRHSALSELRGSVTQQQYEHNGVLKNVKGAHTALDGAGRIPESWARFPSHTRPQRNGPARSESQVCVKDFAVKTESVDGRVQWLTDQDCTINSAAVTCSKKATSGPRVLSGKLGKLIKIGLDKLAPPQHAQGGVRYEVANPGGVVLDSSQILSKLEYPELHLQPSPGAFRELQALEHEIVSLKSTLSHYSRQLSEAHQTKDDLPVISKSPISVMHKVSYSVDGTKEHPMVTPVEDFSSPAETTQKSASYTIPPITPSNNKRILLDQEVLMMSDGSSASASEVFVTPASRTSDFGTGSTVVSGATNPEAIRLNNGSVSVRSSYSVIKSSPNELGTSRSPLFQTPNA